MFQVNFSCKVLIYSKLETLNLYLVIAKLHGIYELTVHRDKFPVLCNQVRQMISIIGSFMFLKK
jgi:hypothetical protein